MTYKEWGLSIYGLSVRLEELLRATKCEATQGLLSQIRAFQDDFSRYRFQIAVVGEFNRGKSSLLNILLGQQILPEGVVATTAAINRITYGSTPRAYIRFKDRTTQDKEISLDKLTEYVTKLTEESAAVAATIDEIVIEYPSVLGLTDVDFIDTPGLNDDVDMNEITLSQLEQANMAIVALMPLFPYSDTENQFVLSLLEKRCISQILFVCTHMDQVDEEDQERILSFTKQRIQENIKAALEQKYPADDKIFKKYHRVFDDIKLFGVSSTMAKEALALNSTKLYQQSGFSELMQELPPLITGSQNFPLLFDSIEKILEVCKNYREQLKNLSCPDAERALQVFEKKLTAASFNFWKGPAKFMEQLQLIPNSERTAACDHVLQAFYNSKGCNDIKRAFEQVRTRFQARAQGEELHALMRLSKESAKVRRSLYNDLEMIFSGWPDIQQELHPMIRAFLAPEPYAGTQTPSDGFHWSENLDKELERFSANDNFESFVRGEIDKACQEYMLRWKEQVGSYFSAKETLAKQQAEVLLRQAKQEMEKVYLASPVQDKISSGLDEIEAKGKALQQQITELML